MNDPLWFKDAIIYELHVKAFFDGNNDGVGDFGGLLQKIDYLQELGVTCIWLLPFFPSPLRDDGYDIADYTSVHPSYGTLDEFRSFLDAAHERGMQVMIELVINHTSDQHPWFQAARKAPPGSPERDFYVWSDDPQKYKEVRIIFTDTEKSNWSWDAEAKAYYWHRFFSHQPDLNYDNPQVVEEVIRIMRYWLDMGVDGLRLDAIPYLVERDGTNCENLPETHTIIKRIRQALDERHPNRVILAEANQWPTDVRPYFGDGDECHMAFHFPLMPRLFMALRLEDRHPITEIMAQTPEIPENCQWGLFLRNHDELTLEMVSDEERDYMYYAYSADPRMRINIGIRRRLAPLMDNNLRRVELLNSILFSFQGTPILYYGDEIGMGDNIYLGDRDGVRTPMQWNADRNAGFSRATPGRLYHPVIMDPVYGYESVNVEAQQSDSSSLLHWMRNMIALRKLFKVFGRGSLEFLNPANRKVLAYTRCDAHEQILCVANLSRFPQPVELDLSRFDGMIPVEMIGFVEFPEIRKAPYPLTLGPYGFLWFELQPSGRAAEVETVPRAAEEAPLEWLGAWEPLLNGRTRGFLERVYLPPFLERQRWFGGKARKLERVSIGDWAEAPGSGAALLFLDVEYADGGRETYLAPLQTATDDRAATILEEHPDAVVTSWDGRVLFDATFDPQFNMELLDWVNGSLHSREGIVEGIAGVAYPALRGEPGEPLEPARGGSEQSNTSIRYGRRMILKLFRRVEPGTNPDCEITRHLSETCGFHNVPRFGGQIDYSSADRGAATIAMVSELVDNQGDGWEWTLEELGRYYERCGAAEETPELARLIAAPLAELAVMDLPPLAEEMIGLYRDATRTLARRTAEMHLALGKETSDPAFRPEPLTTADLAQLAENLRRNAIDAFDQLKNNLAHIPDDLMEMAGLVLGRRRILLDRFRGLERLEDAGLKCRVHGDYHLGQVLRVLNDFVLLDFEGEPARSMAERRVMHSPLKDTAGMLRSFGYAAQVGYLNHSARRPHEAEKLEPWARLWERLICAVFLQTYREVVAGQCVSADAGTFARLLDAFVLDKALYELKYELNNRPAWVRIPLLGILALGGEK
ncbi:MAG: maltose alpha-D-glucosyltransferase [Bryobacterales bacterium]|nr:maltose alpha-D-glucosyltransferase [Bryobacterales bacterium]